MQHPHPGCITIHHEQCSSVISMLARRSSPAARTHACGALCEGWSVAPLLLLRT
jgi:hypothetical protein